MAFGKLKRLIKKTPTIPKSKPDDSTTPDSTPTPAVVDEVTSTDETEPITKTSAAAAAALTGPCASKESYNTDADNILEGILQDLNIKVGQLAVDAEKESDTVSEYSGGSAKSLETSSGEETSDGDDDDDDDDDDDEETDDDESEASEVEKPKAKGKKKKRNTVGDRVAAVVAAAEEIRKKRNSPVPSKESGKKATSAAESGAASRSTTASPVLEPPASVVAPKEEQAPASSNQKASEVESKPSKNQKDKSREKGSKSSSRPSMKAIRKSPITTFMPRPKNRSTAPESSPEIKPKFPPVNSNSKSFETREDDHTSETREVSEEEGTCDGEENTPCDNTLGTDTLGTDTCGTDGMSYEDHDGDMSMSDSQNDGTIGDARSMEEHQIKAKKTVMNKDIIIHQPGGPSNLVVRAMYYTPLPASPDDIIVKVEASTVSFRDCLLRRDIGTDKVKFPFVPGCEVVGTISNIGRAARQEGYRVGDRVVGLTRRGGGNGYYAKLTTKNVAPVLNPSIDAADVVCLVDVYMTAYQALRVGKKDGTPLTDAHVLITDGFSPVGQAAVQLAKLEGANVYVTTTETRQDEYMKSLGVKCLPLAPSKWLHKLKGKMDIVIDNTCFDTYDSSWKALNATGVLVCTGMTSIYRFQDLKGPEGCGCDAFGDTRDIQAKWATMKARYIMSQTKFHDLSESFQNDPKKYQQELKYLCFLVESGTLKPKIAERVSIEEIPDAQRYLETGKANGTIVCLP
eukprot:CAMPEP_0172305140 /NCGR_PEP_ID=MMETSP1058-20130122/6466_1 /TAXON_ID=83371 /ORGANISM="Detonula confervacea, Strain CCMP 353" /LENGTH=740 /DNA_ID=CAMNT_0013016631 /DNA_START=79 /DNA_END=2301 /DNA_ORIENTATION=-